MAAIDNKARIIISYENIIFHDRQWWGPNSKAEEGLLNTFPEALSFFN